MKLKFINLSLVIVSSEGGFSHEWKQWTPSDTTWHQSSGLIAQNDIGSAELWQITYTNPERVQNIVTEQYYKNGSLRSCRELHRSENPTTYGWYTMFYPGTNQEDTGQIRFAHKILDHYYDDTLRFWWPNGQLKTLEVYHSGACKFGQSFNEQGEKIDYVPYERFPEFPGGADQLMRYLRKNITYPKKLGGKGITGNVLSSFIVNADGSISDVKIVESPHELFSEEVIRLLNSMPTWIPGSQDGRKVTMEYRLPIRFSMPK